MSDVLQHEVFYFCSNVALPKHEFNNRYRVHRNFFNKTGMFAYINLNHLLSRSL